MVIARKLQPDIRKIPSRTTKLGDFGRSFVWGRVKLIYVLKEKWLCKNSSMFIVFSSNRHSLQTKRWILYLTFLQSHCGLLLSALASPILPTISSNKDLQAKLVPLRWLCNTLTYNCALIDTPAAPLMSVVFVLSLANITLRIYKRYSSLQLFTALFYRESSRENEVSSRNQLYFHCCLMYFIFGEFCRNSFHCLTSPNCF